MGTNVEAAASGNYREALESLRDTLADQLDNTDSNVHAQLSAQYRATLSELAAVVKAEKEAEAAVNESQAVAGDEEFDASAI